MNHPDMSEARGNGRSTHGPPRLPAQVPAFAFVIVTFLSWRADHPAPVFILWGLMATISGAILSRRQHAHAEAVLAERTSQLDHARGQLDLAEQRIAAMSAYGVVVCECGHGSSYHASVKHGTGCMQQDRDRSHVRCACQNTQEQVLLRFSRDDVPGGRLGRVS